jgi:hemerythrin
MQLKRLIDFTQMHFESEEQLLSQHGFPGAEQHGIAHHQLLGQLYTALEHVNHDEAVHLNSVLEFLPAWYLDHVEKLDQPYGAWLNERGVF